MREMVYDDARWVQRLQSMACWNETQARRGTEDSRQNIGGVECPGGGRREGIGVDGVNGTTANMKKPSRSSTTIFEATESTRKMSGNQARVGDEFNATVLSPTSPQQPVSPSNTSDPASRLSVFLRVRSVRGHARQEYGKIHGALSPFHNDAVQSESHTDAIVFRTYRDPNHQAQMLSNITRFAKCDTSQGWQSRQEKLDGLKDAFETAVAREFEHGLIDGDIEGRMRKYAHVLATLNGCVRGVDMFISRSQIISERLSMGNPLGCLNTGNFSMDNSYRSSTMSRTRSMSKLPSLTECSQVPSMPRSLFFRGLGRKLFPSIL